jgi:hypothetical protein
MAVRIATLALPAPEETAPLKRVVLAACISAGAIFSHEVAVVVPAVVALTHYLTSTGSGLRRKTGREALLIVAISYSLYFAFRLAFFHVPASSAYPLRGLSAEQLATNCVYTILLLFFPFGDYINAHLFLGSLGGRIATPAGYSMLFMTLLIYYFLARKLMNKSRYSSETRMLATCALVASTSLVLTPDTRQMSIVLVYSLPLLYMALEPFTFRELKQLRLAQAGTVLIAGAISIYLALGLRSILKVRADVQSMDGYARSMEHVLVSAIIGGGNHIFLINDIAGGPGARAMLQLTAKENGVTLVNPTVVNQLNVSTQGYAYPVQGDSGVLVECRSDVLSIRIELAAGRTFEFYSFESLPFLNLANNGSYKFPSIRRTQRKDPNRPRTYEDADFGSNLVFTSPTKCSQTAVVGFPGRGELEPRVFFLGTAGAAK